MRIFKDKSNNIGVLASSICLVHCLATPFLFLSTVCFESCCSSAPTWWKLIDVVFLVIALFAVYHSAKTTTKKLVSLLLWLSWGSLLLIVLNEQLQFFSIVNYAIYLPAFSLIILHLINHRYYQNLTENCCVNN